MNLNILLSEFKRLQFLDYKKWLEIQREQNLSDPNTLEFLQVWKPKIGIYAGSFNPFHYGHLNILEKAEKIFDKVIIAYGINPEKKPSCRELFPRPTGISDHQIIEYQGLLTDMIDSLGYDVTLIRGLRNSTDLQYELTQFKFMQDLKSDIKIVNIFCDKEFEHLSSSAIRSLVSNYNVGNQYIVK